MRQQPKLNGDGGGHRLLLKEVVISARTLTLKLVRVLGESRGLIRVENVHLTKVQCPFVGDVHEIMVT